MYNGDNNHECSASPSGKLVEKEHMELGVVGGHVYRSYWKAVGDFLSPTIILFVCLMTGWKMFLIYNSPKNFRVE